MPRDRYERPEGELLAKVLALAPKYGRPHVDPGSGKEEFHLLNELSPEFKALKQKIAPQYCPMGPEHRATAAAMGMMPPDVLRGAYPTYADAVKAALTLKNGAAYFYGLQASAATYKDAALAEEILRGINVTKTLLCWNQETFDVIGPERVDVIMLDLTERWDPKRDLMMWGLLEHHKAWSETLSKRLIASVRDAGAESRNVMWSFGGNGYALYMHPSLLAEAVNALEPWWRTQGNAKRWRKKLQERIKAGGGAKK